MKKQESLISKKDKAAQILKNGGVIIFPSDTVYGIGCLWDNQEAVERIYKIKGTKRTQSFPILVASPQAVKDLALVTPLAASLMKKHWPGGLTIILKAKNSHKTLGFRMPNSILIKSLIKKVGKPIIGTSANFHDLKSVSDFKSLDPKLVKLADYVLEGECDKAIESTVVDTTGGKVTIIRQGAVKIDIPIKRLNNVTI